ncbi:helix-turn-helix domain-containing protein [Streptomyces antnestii]|uniref:helix-turn-helix domain-containing protein n=1 Tax=Streptomyces antnestii TaxID=2494256 RepID=UPI001CB93CD4|nr:XRE family transcriptional regulator [Streptomyces sp. San01]
MRRERPERGFTPETLAGKTGLSRSYLSNVERDVNSPTINTLRTIVDALGTTLSQLHNPMGRLEMMLLEVTPGVSSGESPHSHAGEEVGLLLSGELDHWVPAGLLTTSREQLAGPTPATYVSPEGSFSRGDVKVPSRLRSCAP